MQGLYTYFNNKAVNMADARQKVFDNLIEEPQFYNATPQEKTGFQMLLPVLLDEAFDNTLKVNELQENQRWLGMLSQKAVADWNNDNRKELERIFGGLQHDLQNQLPLEVTFWQVLTGVIRKIEQGEERRQARHIAVASTPEHELKILKHPFFKALTEALHPETGPQPLGLKPLDSEEMARIFTVLFKELPEYQSYKLKKETTLEEDEEIFKVLYRRLFKSVPFNEIMSDRDMRWAENRILLEVSLKATFRQLLAGEAVSFRLDVEEVTEYEHLFKTLINSTLDSFEEDNLLIEQNLKNWEPDRVALLDKYLIHLSINEMRQFAHIPVKVTMNEYLEIAKAYSTPGSASFINGVVDKLATLLKTQGAVKKSAKGLMDNK